MSYRLMITDADFDEPAVDLNCSCGWVGWAPIHQGIQLALNHARKCHSSTTIHYKDWTREVRNGKATHLLHGHRSVSDREVVYESLRKRFPPRK